MSNDFRPTANWQNLRLRADLLRRTREFFDSLAFLEVETPILSADTVVDRHLDPFCVDVAGRQLWLQTSPEFAMKRLLAAGAEAIYQITRAFRLGEQGPLHNPEFTMVEWYRTGDYPDEGMALTGRLCDALLRRGPAERVSYAEAFERHVGLNPHTAETGALVASVRKHGIAAPGSLAADDRDGWLELLLVERVRPHLGTERPTILCDYPAGQSALAQIRDGDPPVAERFELFVDGIELANGYHELLDADELSRRNQHVNAQRRRDGKPPLPGESRLLAAMRAGLPGSVGVAMGFDRVVMLAAGAKSLAEVTAFPWDRA
ncbi:MAG: EF-P lysine aminoacylase GenX [Candidatus Nealsonbacteria bacterium]|nr:EF-P lysine aminoacylase GenX [Candidatus Nealsonbacteria bacterium]